MSTTWIYHERQEALLCGQHALNNLVQASVFTPGSLAEIAHQLDQMELNFMAESNEKGVHSKDYLRRLNEGSGNVDAQGNFSIQVLRAALQNGYNISLPNMSQQGVLDGKDVTDVEGFICNRSSHWFAIRKINGRYWNLNSTLEKPELISHFRLAVELEGLQVEGYSVFCVTEGLPEPCSSSSDKARGNPQFWWKESYLLVGKSEGSNHADSKINADPWSGAGSGRRLDGKRKTRSTDVVELTEVDDDLAMAIAMSQSEAEQAVAVPEEPAPDATGAVRIQIRMPNGKREIRRFLESDLVAVVYAFVHSKTSGCGQLELRCGFPPKDISSQKTKTIAEAKLAGESIQGRFV